MDINEILSSLSADDIKNLQDMAQTLMNGEKEDTSCAGDIFSGMDINAFSNIASVMARINSGDDARCRLIMSLKPLLSPERQKRADEAVRILKIIELVPILKESGLLNGVL